ncbi:adenine deaminase [Fusobacterium mortiferum]|jgi:adenine deaminase|uniref:Adenine deaminase n=2 Tax=Fusobacterium mortiferum TaxID=850 RepID=A0A414PR34_FUSMR|nr:adenine deaminase C-terminal domain-containing protein [Fusobacterium mortiferum]AVQ18096.1 adenine deaminase [Fusobacterium mortiferum ATCC 9817]EEO36626.1 putative adenine deaminase [Fusobacterium mortiferum ATCC 9817]MCF2627825.1 adenine deaminase [Fusobacterium mortiferum]MCF2699514.1 adenine deaminase [Fusobacterium mortiferum]MCI7664790.1 amidohydrolase family protein [Fusobacterium mortiferum]
MKVDLLVKNVKVFNSYLKKFKDGNVAILNNKFLYIDNNKNIEFEASSTIDGKNQYMIPGFIDIHMHIESSMMTPAPFCHHLSKNGVTTIVAEPHEIANVFGKKGIEAMIAAENSINTSIFYGIPSSVPSTSPDLETTGAILDFEEMKNLTSNPKVICIGEIMNYRKVIVDNSLDICKFIEYVKKNKPQYAIEGHCPKLLDLDLAKFLYLGINGDHTEHTFEEFVQRFENGMFMELQAKSISSELINYIKENNLYEHFAFVTDDTMPDTFLHKGHLNVVIKKAIQAGINIENAIYCATFTPARRMNLHDRGVIAPGKKADFLLIDNLKNLHITQTFIDGKEVYNINSEAKYIPTDYKFPEEFYQSVRVEKINEDIFQIPVNNKENEVNCRIIKVIDGSTRTTEIIEKLNVKNGYLDWENSPYMLIAVFERHGKNGNIGFGLVTGDCIKNGAIATTYAHDHHNLMVIGKNIKDMTKTINRIIELQGGICCVENEEILAEVPLPVAGILSEKTVQELGKEVEILREKMSQLGYKHYNPIMSLCTLSLPVSPALKITDKGLIDVNQGKIVNLIID